MPPYTTYSKRVLSESREEEKEEIYLRDPLLSHKQNISDITVQTKASVEKDIHTKERRMTPKYTEVSCDVNHDQKVQIVMPLGALDQTLDITKQDPSNQTSTSQGTPEFSVSNEITGKHTKPSQTVCVLEPDVLKHRLDWNKLFTFMAYNINSLEWKLFFIELFGHCQHLLPRGMDVNSIIEQTESDRKGGSIRTFFFELFIEWRKVMGNEACPSLIEASLKQLGDTIKLEKFTAFMRDPPLQPEKLSHCISSIETEVLKPLLPIANQTSCDFMHTFKIPEQQPQAQIMALHDVIRSQSCTNQNDTVYSRSHETSGLAIKWMSSNEVNVPGRYNLPRTSGSAHNRGMSSREYNASYVSLRGKRPRTYYDTSSSDSEEVIPFKNRKYDNMPATPFSNKSVKRKRKKAINVNEYQELIQWKKDSMGWIMELIVKLLQSDSTVLEANQYKVFLDHTVSLLMKKACYPEETILSVLVEDYEKVLEQKTNRGHVTFILDTTDGILHLGTEEWDYLKLYAEKARTRIIERQMKTNDEFVASKFLFIDYDGQVLAKQENVDVSATTKEGEKLTEPEIMKGVQTGEEDVKKSESHIVKSAASHICTNITPLSPVFGKSNMSKEDVLSKQENVDISTTTKEGVFTKPKIMEGVQTGEEDVKDSELPVDKSATPHLCTIITPLKPAFGTSNTSKEDVLAKQENVDVSTKTNEGEKITEPKIMECMQTGEEDVKESESYFEKSTTSHLYTNITPLYPVAETRNMPKEDMKQSFNTLKQPDIEDPSIDIKESSNENSGENLDNPGGTVKSLFVLDDTRCGTIQPSDNKTMETLISHNNTETSTETIFSLKKERIVKENDESSKDMADEDIDSFLAYMGAEMKEIALGKETKTNDNEDNYADN